MRWSHALFSFMLVLSFSSNVMADTSQSSEASPHHASKPVEVKKSAEQIQEAKELEQLNPEEYRLLVLGSQIYLGRFGYGVGPFTGTLDQPTKDALRAYQKYVGISETGTINKETLKHMTEDNKVLDQILPFIPKFNFEGSQWPEMFSAHGTWAVENLPVQEALQTSQVSCHQKWNLCSVSTAKLAPGFTPTLLSYTNVYEIEKWTESEIVTKSANTGTCVSTVLHIQRTEQSVTRLTTFEQSDTGPCAQMAPRDFPMHLADGSQIYRALKHQKNQDAQRILRVNQAISSKPSPPTKP